jgi:hypothetical protein
VASFSPFFFLCTGGWRQGRFAMAAISGLFTRLEQLLIVDFLIVD